MITTPIPLYSVVIPVHDERENIAPLLREVSTALPTPPHEVLVVDDGSGDGTSDVLGSLEGQIPHLRILRHRHRCGQSAALATGIRAARTQWIATLDGDGQNDPADIATLLELLGGAGPPPRLELVAGIRVRRADSAWKRFSSRIANSVRKSVLRDGTPDTGCGLKLIRRDAFLALPFFDHMHRFLPALIQRHGGEVATAEVNHRPRRHGRSKYGTLDRLWAGITDLLGVLWLKRRMQVPVITEVRTPPFYSVPGPPGRFLTARVKARTVSTPRPTSSGER